MALSPPPSPPPPHSNSITVSGSGSSLTSQVAVGSGYRGCKPRDHYPIFISVHMKPQVVLSTGGIFETIFIAALQAIPYQLISIHLTTSLYQVQIIILFLGTVSAEEKMLA